MPPSEVLWSPRLDGSELFWWRKLDRHNFSHVGLMLWLVYVGCIVLIGCVDDRHWKFLTRIVGQPCASVSVLSDFSSELYPVLCVIMVQLFQWDWKPAATALN